MKNLTPQRVAAVDVFRALTMFLMLFVNDIPGLKNIPHWLKHAEMNEDMLGFSDTIFPAFLFCMGKSVSFAIQNRYRKGDTTLQVIAHIFWRTVALIAMGLFSLNSGGIEGGISIIGTTGIVEPMSNSALVDTIRLEERMRREEGCRSLLLTLGNYSQSFIQRNMPFALARSVTCRNFIGEAIEAALEYGFERILIIGHIGKMAKLGAGIMNTHSAQADGRMEVLVTCGLLAGADVDTLKKITECVTVDAAVSLLQDAGALEKSMEILGKRAEYYLAAKVKSSVPIGAVMFSDKFGILVRTPSADGLVERISEEYNG